MMIETGFSTPTLVFLLIAIAAGGTMLGSFAGLGGGVIIGPLLLLVFTSQSPAVVEWTQLLSVTGVLAAVSVALFRRIIKKQFPVWPLVIGLLPTTIIGSFLGTNYIADRFQSNETLYFSAYISLLVFLILLVFVRRKIKWILPRKAHFWMSPFIGLFVGALAGSFAVGGSIIMMPVLISFFRMPLRKAIPSAFLITFGSSLTTLVVHLANINLDLTSTNWWMLIILLGGGAVGGLCGSLLSRLAPSRIILLVYQIILLLLIVEFIVKLIQI